jgi:hypothetical protein
LQHTSTALRPRRSRMSGSSGRGGVIVNRARLISLLITASLIAVFVARLVLATKTGGMNDGGF